MVRHSPTPKTAMPVPNWKKFRRCGQGNGASSAPRSLMKFRTCEYDGCTHPRTMIVTKKITGEATPAIPPALTQRDLGDPILPCAPPDSLHPQSRYQ